MAGASNAEEPAHEASSASSASSKDGRRRTVRKTFRISAVWQPPRFGAPDGQDPESEPRAAGTGLSDEELVYALVTASVLARYCVDAEGHTTSSAYGRLAVVDGALAWDVAGLQPR